MAPESKSDLNFNNSSATECTGIVGTSLAAKFCSRTLEKAIFHSSSLVKKKLLQGICNRIKGAFVENGHAMLTNQRFIYSKHSLSKIAVMGALVNLTKGDWQAKVR